MATAPSKSKTTKTTAAKKTIEPKVEDVAAVAPAMDIDDVAPAEAPEANPMDSWASAMAEQEQAEAAAAKAAADKAAEQAKAVKPAEIFKQFEMPAGEKNTLDINVIKDIPVLLTVELGRTHIAIRELLQLGQGAIIELEKIAGEPMDIYINGFHIAQGEVVVVGDKYGMRLTDIVSPSERLSNLQSRK